MTGINPESLFLNTALKVGHVLHTINGKKFTSFEEGTKILKGFTEGELKIEVSQTPSGGDVDTGGISYDIGSNESINGLGELDTAAPADLPSHNNATQSNTTTTTLNTTLNECIGGSESPKKGKAYI